MNLPGTSHSKLYLWGYMLSKLKRLNSVVDDYGREVRGEHMGPIEKRHTGNTEKEQFRFEFRGVVSERVHHGSP
jgi:hypothetical protein